MLIWCHALLELIALLDHGNNCDWLCENPPCSRVLQMQVHSNACSFLIDAPIYKCFTCREYYVVIWHQLHVQNLHLKVRKNLHANMEGFHRAGYNYNYAYFQPYTVMLKIIRHAGPCTICMLRRLYWNG